MLHEGFGGLALSNPLIPAMWLLTAPAARRYVAGWPVRDELHMLAPARLRERASKVPGSAEMLALTAACLYARRVIAENNPDLSRVMGLIRARRELRWAWLVEGSARFYGGQTAHARPAIARRLREGSGLSGLRFPPSLRDASLLGGTVLDLLARERGDAAVARLATRLPSAGPSAALADAFGQAPRAIEDRWRTHLTELAAAP